MTWVATGASVLSAGAGIYGATKKGKGPDLTPYMTPLPGYKESDAARGQWWNELQGYNPSNMYGAIQPNWEDIWSNSANKIKQYFWGSPTTTGVADKVKASAARRGVSGSPAMEKTLARLAATEGQQLGDLATQQGLAKAQLGETARQFYVNSLSGLTSQRPQFLGGSPGGGSSGNGWTAASQGFGGIADIVGSYNNKKWWDTMMSTMNGTNLNPNNFPPGVG